MPPKRKANQGASLRGCPKRATKDTPVSSDGDEDLLPPDAGPARPLKKPRKAAALAAARLGVDVDHDYHNDFEERENHAVSAKTGLGKSRGKAAARTAKPANLDVFSDTDLGPAKSAKKHSGTPTRADPKQQTVYKDFGDDEGDPKPTTIEQSLLKQNKGAKQYLQEFKQTLLSSQDEAKKSLVAARRHLVQPRPTSRYDLIAEIRGALQPMMMPNNRNPVADQAQKIFDLGHTMLNAHRAMEKVTRQPHLINTIQGWEQDREMMEKLLLYGKKEGIKIVDRIIDPYHERRNVQRQPSRGGVQGGGERTVEEEALAFVMYSTLKKDKDSRPTWGVAARKQLEALIQAVNTLPVSPGNEKETK